MVQTKAFLFSASIGPDKALSSVLPIWHWSAICCVPLGSIPAILIQAILVLAVCTLTFKMEAVCSSERLVFTCKAVWCKKLKGQNLILNGDVWTQVGFKWWRSSWQFFENYLLIFYLIMLQKWVFTPICIQIVQLVFVIFVCDFKWEGWTERDREAFTQTDWLTDSPLTGFWRRILARYVVILHAVLPWPATCTNIRLHH